MKKTRLLITVLSGALLSLSINTHANDADQSYEASGKGAEYRQQQYIIEQARQKQAAAAKAKLKAAAAAAKKQQHEAGRDNALNKLIDSESKTKTK